MQNIAYRLALLAGIGGLILLTTAAQGEDLRTSLGAVLIAVALLLLGLGKGVELLEHVREGAIDPEENP